MSASDLVIEVKDAGKRYVKYEDQPMLVSSLLRLHRRSVRNSLWAIRHLDLAVARGECVGVIGRNGSGKSTTLQMLAGVTAPTEGSVAVRGRIAPLVSVGVGFHPELTGRENVYLNGTILGMSKDEIDERFQPAVDFAEIHDFIDTPVKFYSSGMFVRLGFSVAIQARPDVLLVDEVLAVGDLPFQIKCFDQMMALAEGGTTIVVVSHSLNAIRKLCPRTLLMDRGQLAFDGATAEAISLYHDMLARPREISGGREAGDRNFTPGVASFESFDVAARPDAPPSHYDAGDDMRFRGVIRLETEVVDPVLGFALLTETGGAVYVETFPLTGRYGPAAPLGFEVGLRAALATGSYSAHCTLSATAMKALYARAAPALFYVSGRNRVSGFADLDAKLTVAETTLPEVQSQVRGDAARA